MNDTTLMTQAASLTGISKEHLGILHEILADVKTSVERLAKAGKRWVELPEKVRLKIIEQTNPSFRDFWRKLERVGSGELHPELAAVGGRAASYLGRLPILDQERYLREMLPVVVAKGRGYDVRLVDVSALSEDQRKQVFKVQSSGAVSVREIEAQKVWLADRAAKLLLEKQAGESLRRVERAGWVVESGRVWLKPALVENGITRRHLEKMLADCQD